MFEEHPKPPPAYDILRVRQSCRMVGLASLDHPAPGVIEESITIPARDGYEIPTRIHRPETIPTEGSPLILMYHSGGYYLGDPDGETLNSAILWSILTILLHLVKFRPPSPSSQTPNFQT